MISNFENKCANSPVLGTSKRAGGTVALKCTLLGAVAFVLANSILSVPVVDADPASSNAAQVPSAPNEKKSATGEQSAPMGFAELVSATKPAVVSVRSMSTPEPIAMERSRRPPHERAPAPNAKRSLEQSPEQTEPQFKMAVMQASGFFVSPDGYAVTSSQVAENAAQIEIATEGNVTIPARVVGNDPKTGLALLKVDARGRFPFVEFATEKPRTGDWVVAMGSPFGLGTTVTAGIVSTGARSVGALKDLLQLNIPANIGDAGGPAFSMGGKVVSVTTAVLMGSDGSSGFALAVPAPVVQKFVRNLMARG